MPRPNENWGDSDWDEFHKAGGRPETAADYNIKRNEAIPEELISQETMDGFQKLLFKHGASKKLVDALMTYNDEQTLKMMKQHEEKTTEFNTRLWDSLHDTWGAAYDQRVRRAKKSIERGTNEDEGFYQRVLSKVDKSADLIKFMANMEDKFSEHEPVERHNIDTPADLDSQIREIEQSADYRSTNQKVRLNAAQRASRLRTQKREDKQSA